MQKTEKFMCMILSAHGTQDGTPVYDTVALVKCTEDYGEDLILQPAPGSSMVQTIIGSKRISNLSSFKDIYVVR